MLSDNRAAGESAAEDSLTPIELRQTIQALQARLSELAAENAALKQARAERTRPGKQIDGPDDDLVSHSPYLSTADSRQSYDLLQERIKELSCLYEVAALLNRTDLAEDELAHTIVDRIAAAYQYPAVTCACLTLDERAYTTKNFVDTPWQQTSPITSGSERVGALTVGYLEERPPADEGPFLKEERALLDQCCWQLGQATERRRLRGALAASELRFRALIECASDGVVLVGADRQLCYASPSAARMLGYSLEEFMQPGALTIHPDDLDAIERGWLASFTSPRQAIDQTYRARHRDGTWRWLAATVTNLLGDPAANAIVVNFRDITERRLADLELAKSNARFQSLFENMTLGVVYQDSDGHITLANRAAQEILGLSLDQMTGRTSLDPHWRAMREDGSDLPGEEHPAMVALRTGKVVTDVLMGVYHPGREEERWIRVAAVPEFHPGETTPFRVFATFDDVTERRQSEQAIAENERLYRTAILGSGAVPYRYDYKTETYSFMPPEGEKLTGYKLEDLTPNLLQSIILDAVPRGQSTGVALTEASARARSSESGHLWQWDYLIRTKSGAERWIADAAVQLLDDQGTPVGSIGILHDVTERMQTEAALRASEERYRRLVEELEDRVAARTAEVRDLYENAPCGYHTIDATGAFTMVNQTELDWLGYTRGEMIGHAAREFLTPESLQVYLDNYPRLIADGVLADLEFEMRCKDGGVLPVTLSATATYDADGRFVESRGSIFDVSQRKRAQQAQLASEARLNFLLTHTPAIIYTAAITPEGIRTTFLSESISNMLGYSRRHYEGDPDFWNSLVHPDDRASGLSAVQTLATTGTTIWEHRVRHADGSYRWHATGMNLLHGAADGPPEIIGYSVDIHEHKLAREALRISEARYRSVLENAPATISEIDRDGIILSQNRSLLGRPLDTIVGHSILDVAPPGAESDVDAALHAVFTAGQNVHFESTLEIAPGDVHHFVSFAGPISIDGAVASAVVVTMEITELKRVQTELQRQRDFAQQVMDAMGEGLVVGDRTQHAEYVNPFMARLLDSTPAELLGGAMTDYIHPEDLPDLFKRLAEHPPEASHRYELRVRSASGRIVPTLVSSTPRWQDGEIAGRIAVFTDLTRIKQIETELRRSRDDLRETNAALEKAMRMKDEFLASMSHELRTPLTGILGLSESLQLQTSGVLNERQVRAVQYIWESGQHLLDLINDVLDLSKLAADQFDLVREICSVGDLCHASLTLVKGMAGKKGQHVAFAMEPETIMLEADARRMKQMLVNLLSNAIKFTPPEGELGLQVHGDAERAIVEFRVWDKGIGIAATVLPHIFEPFTQVDSSLTREHSGSGLGLALVQRMAKLHGGALTVVSEPGNGSTFTLTLPWIKPAAALASLDAASTVMPAEVLDAGSSAMPATAGPLVLVAEDDPVNADILCEVLTSKGFAVSLATTGEELLRKAAETTPALILMDVRMPQLDGLEATRRLRAHPEPALATVPIIILTAQAMQGDAERSLAAGASAYIAKPYSMTALLSAIQAHLAPEEESP